MKQVNLESFINNLVTSRLAQNGAALCNRIPFPYTRLPVRVGAYRMVAHTLDRYVVLWLWKLGLVESFESDLLSQLCQPGMVAVDIGANIGYYSLLLARYVGNKGQVWAFEPDPGNFTALQYNLKENKCLNIRAINSAVGAKSEKQYLYISQSHNGDHRLYQSGDSGRIAIPVDVVALDEFFSVAQRIDLIKMDIQGAEGLALAGMKRILMNNPHLTLLMEFWPAGLTRAGFMPERVLTDLQAMGFVLACVDERRGVLTKIEQVANFVRSLSGEQYLNILAKYEQ